MSWPCIHADEDPGKWTLEEMASRRGARNAAVTDRATGLAADWQLARRRL